MKTRLEDRLPPEPIEPLRVECSIIAPVNGSTVTGPWNGVVLSIVGRALIVTGTGSIDRVEIEIGAGGFRSAVQTGSGWSSWTAEAPVTASGTVAITARAVVVDRIVATHRIVVGVALQPRPQESGTPEPPSSPPSVAIVSPADGSTVVLRSSNRRDVTVEGTALDHGVPITAVEVSASGGGPVQASRAGDGWSRWTAVVTIVGEGPHTVTARAVNRAGSEDSVGIQLFASTEPLAPPAVERLVLVEKVRLSTYLGAYGAGRTIKTLSLLPGERTTVMVKSYKRTTLTEKEASSILDSYMEDSETDFRTELLAEQSNQSAAQESEGWNISGTAEARWGWGSASLTGGVEASTNATREELAKTVSTAVHKHAAKASAKRDIDVRTSRELTVESGEEQAAETQIENINVSRTLNFTFRQMNQEFISILHLVDVRVAYVRGDRVLDENGEPDKDEEGNDVLEFTSQVVTLPQLRPLLRHVLIPDKVEEVEGRIVSLLSNIFDYEDKPRAMIEKRVLVDVEQQPILDGEYWRVPRSRVSTYRDPATGTEIVVPGVILSVMKNVMRTDGVVCDAILGHGDALDAYSKGVQDETILARRIENARQQAALRMDRLAIGLIKRGDAEGARIFKELQPPHAANALALVTASPNGGGALGASQ